jgi:hypothetical protein
VTQSHLLNIKAGSLSRLESLWLLLSIILLISSTLCLAVAAVALILPGVNMVMIWLAIAGLVLGSTSVLSIKELQRRQHVRMSY